jgi:hypothetical protein
MVGVVGVPMASASTRSPSSYPERAKWSIGYKCPREVRVVGRVPITAAHKLDRFALRRPAGGEQKLRDG